ncbi:hypothetical protein Drose_15300 [Dactylosporangium roseum]|uniref:Uncharacterized protein n=1 Tax=Dactylosporangium roseum TaxID=47989 RepID=A0ABY5ZEU1_9ACTN|nr:hypothetical protein [Dactylosporangium roseum]UWZ39478.1 hypothetical protein Drose_15300 [Dactylosporangium roseum]
MNAEARASDPVRSRMWGRRIGRAAAYLIAGALNTFALLCVLLLWASWLSGAYHSDRDLQENGGIFLLVIAVFGGLSAGLALLVSVVAAGLRWMPRWAIAMPGILLAFTVLATCGMAEIFM